MSQRARHDGLRTAETQNVNVSLPRWLVAEVRLLALDPSNGRMRYGQWSRIFEDALREWLSSQRINSGTGDFEPLHYCTDRTEKIDG